MTGESGKAKGGRAVVVIHGYGTYAILYRHMVEMAKREAPGIDWAMILPTSHHLAAIREVLDESRILCLENRQARRMPQIKDLSELTRYGGNIYSDIEAEKRVFKHRRGPEQVTRAVEIYRIYKQFLERSGATHILLSHIETFDGRCLVSLAKELGIHCVVPNDLRNLGGLYFSGDAQETLPAHRRYDPENARKAAEFVAEFRRRPTAALNMAAAPASGGELLPRYQKPLLQRTWRFLRRTAKNPRLFEPELLLTSLRYAFPGIRDGIRRVRGSFNARQFDDASLGDLPSKYIYYPLQTTPESSINTPAPYYVDQLRAIDAIRYAMPSDYTLVVKEHPAYVGMRPPSFYRKLRRRAGVRVVHYRTPSLELIKRAAMTISVTGTATLEAFLLGRPSLVLGSSFITPYLGGVCAIKDLPVRIRDGLARPPADDDIVKALAEIMSVRYECLFRPPDEAEGLAAHPENIRRLLHGLLDHLSRLGVGTVESGRPEAAPSLLQARI